MNKTTARVDDYKKDRMNVNRKLNFMEDAVKETTEDVSKLLKQLDDIRRDVKRYSEIINTELDNLHRSLRAIEYTVCNTRTPF